MNGSNVADTTAPAATLERPRPTPGDPRPYAFPRFERRSLSNGLRLVVAPVEKLPVVTLLATINAGAVADPPGEEGLALLTARALSEGAGSRDGAALADYAERLGAGIESRADWDVATVRMTVMTSRLADAVPLLGDVLMAPTLPADESRVSRASGSRSFCRSARSRAGSPTRRWTASSMRLTRGTRFPTEARRSRSAACRAMAWPRSTAHGTTRLLSRSWWSAMSAPGRSSASWRRHSEVGEASRSRGRWCPTSPRRPGGGSTSSPRRVHRSPSFGSDTSDFRGRRPTSSR